MRPHIEMASLDHGKGWSPLSGFDGVEVKLLASDLDEARRCGARSRLVRFAPGVSTQGTLTHGYWEEVYILSGDMFSLCRPDAPSLAPMYSIRPPGTPHGPFGSRRGCVLLEVQYFVQVESDSNLINCFP